MHRRFRVPVACLLVATLAAPALSRADEGSAVVVTVAGTPIVRREFDEALRASRVEAIVSPDRLMLAQATVIERLVEERLLRLAIEREGVKVAEADIENAITRTRADVARQGEPFAAFLARLGLDEAGFRRQVEFELAVRKLVEPRVTDASLAAFVEANRREFDGTALRVSHIVLRPDVGRGGDSIAASMRRAERIRRDILAGEVSFAKAAERYSAGPSRHRGGDIGYMFRRSSADEEFARQVFAVSKGEISPPFQTPFGVHIVTVTAMEPGREPAAALTERLRPQFVARLTRDVVAEQRKLRPIEYAARVPHFDPATPAGGGQPRRIIVREPESP